ncbi:MAG: hypothetical protein ACFHWZ_11765 [Phycisphaerales bacterium]
MDDQKRQVEAGAGLQESRLNQDFIDLLKKYGTTVLLVLLVIMATYVGIQRYAQYQEDKTDQAFADLDNAANTPAVLLAVAEQWDGRASVWEIATIRAAKAYLDSAHPHRSRRQPRRCGGRRTPLRQARCRQSQRSGRSLQSRDRPDQGQQADLRSGRPLGPRHSAPRSRINGRR